MPISTNGTIIARLAGGLYNQTLSSATYYEMVSAVKTPADINALANSLVATDFAGKTDAQIATVLLTNLGLTSVAGLNNWVAAQITAAGAAGKGAKIVSLLNDYSNLTADATYGASASSFNGKVDAALVLSQSANFKGGDLNAAATIAAADKAAADAAAAKAAAEAAAKKALDDAAAKKALDDAAAKKALDDAAAKKALDDAAAKKILDDAAAKKILDDKAAAEKILTDAAAKAATDASAAIDAATIADSAVTSAETALATAKTKAALTDATVLTATTKSLTEAVTTATTAKTNADKAVVDANTAYTAALNATTPVAADVVNTNAAVLIATNKAAVAAKALADATAAAALAKTASDAATADDAAVVTSQTALDTAVAAATKAAAAAVAAVATSKTAAAATAATADDAVATSAATVAAGKGAGAAKIVNDAKIAAEKIIADKVIADKIIADKIIADKVIADKIIADKIIADKIIADKVIADKIISDKVIADKIIADKIISDQLAADSAPRVFSLTTNADTTLAGNLGNDSFYGVVGTNGLSTNGTTLNAGDNLDGKAGTGDTLFVTVAGTNTTPITTAGFTLSGVERIDVTNYQSDDAQDNTFNLALATGVTSIAVSSSAASGDTLFTAVKGIVTAGMGNGAGDLSITYVDTAVAGTADVQTLNLTGQTGGTFTAAATSTGGVETIAINSSGSANTVAVTSTTATAITVSGDQNLTLTEGMTNTLTSVNATGFTGRLNFTTDDATAINVVGGSAADTITLGATFGTTDTINGGGGDDTLSIASGIASATALAGVTSVEALTISSADNVTLAANVSPTTFNLAQSTAAANTLTLNTGYTNATTVNLGAGDTVTNSANAVLTVNATDAGMIGSVITGGTAADTLNLTASAATTVVTLNTQAVRVDTITIVDGGDTTATAGRDISITAGAAATSVTVNASALDAGVTGATDATGENLTYVGGGVTTATVVQNVTGGGGNDTISGGAGNDIISGGGGNDSLSGGTGNDSINAGTGDDTINMAATLTSADSIDGGEGADKLILTTIPALSLTNVSNVETLVLGGAGSASLAANVSFTTIDMDDGTNDTAAQSLTLATGYTNATTVLVDAGDSITNTANAALTVTATDAKMAGTTVTGGTGSDILNITATAEGGVAMTLAGTITNVETINLLDGGDVQANTLGNTVTAGRDVNLTVGDFASAATVATTLTVDASTLDAGTVTTAPTMDANYENATINGSAVTNVLVRLALTGGGGADSLTGGAGNDVIVGGAGNDQITPGTGNDNLNGGDDIDTFVMAGNLTFQDTIAGGNGIDIITTSNTTVDADFTNVTSVETLTLAGVAATLGAAASAAGIATVNTATTAFAVNAGTMTTALTVNARGNAVNQTITGGTGADTFNFGLAGADLAQDSLTATDVIAGGTGSDTVNVSNSLGSVSATLELDNVTAVENVTLGTASGLATTSAETVTLTLNNVTLTTVQTINISAAAITDARDTFTVNHEATPNDGGTSYSITGGAGNDVILGGSNNDTIVGGNGNDSITGGAGADSLTGGSGADQFFMTASIGTAKDTISDFTTGTDRIQITIASGSTVNVDMTNKGVVTTNGDSTSLMTGNATTPQIGQYVFNTANNTMLLDLDGNGLIQGSDVQVVLGGNTVLNSSDIDFEVTSTGGDTRMTGGAGNDTFIFAATLTVADTINGGLGTDTLTFTDAGGGATTDIDNVTNVETITLGAAATAFTLVDANVAAGARLTITGSAMATDTTAISGAAETNGNLTMNITSTTGVITLVGGDLADTLTATTSAGTNVTLTGGAGADTLTVIGGTGAALTGGTGADTITGAAGGDTFIYLLQADLVASGALVDSVVGNGGTDILSIGTNGTAFTIAATDSFARMQTVETISAVANSFAVSITLGASAEAAGITTITNSGNLTVAAGNVFNAAAYAGNVTLNLTGTSTAAALTGGSGNDSIVGNAGIDTIIGGAGNDTITGAGAADNMNGGDGDDTFVFLASADLFSNGTTIVDTSITGGNGTDSLLVGGTLNAGYAITDAQPFTVITSVETITGAANTAGISLVLDLTAYAAGIRTIDLSAVTSVASAISVAEFTVAGGATAGITMIGAATVLTSLTGGEGADTITGGSGADVIVGGAGNDVINPGTGADASITPGTGNDTINLGAAGDIDTILFAEGGATNVDTVTNTGTNIFTVGTDIISVSKGTLGGTAAAIATIGGTDISAAIAAGGFASVAIAANANTTLADASNLIIFSSTTATSFATAIGTASLVATTGTNLSGLATLTGTAQAAVMAVFYDSANSQAVYGYLIDSNVTGTAFTATDTFVEIVRIGMPSTSYQAAGIDGSLASF